MKGDLDIEKVLVSKNFSFGEIIYKYFLGYLCNDNKFKPLHIMLQAVMQKVLTDKRNECIFWLKMNY